MATTQTLIDMINDIRTEAGAVYASRVPEATKNNLTDVGGALLGDVDLANKFTEVLMNKVAYVVVHSKIFNNPLAMLKKGNKPLGDSVEEIFVNYAKAEQYDATGSNLLNRKLPDVKAVYHTMNRQDKYKVTISHAQLSKAFRDYGSFDKFVSGIISSLYNGANLDEFVLFKQLFKLAIDQKKIKVKPVSDPTGSVQEATDFIKALKIVSGGMQFPSELYNAYTEAQSTDTTPVVTFTPVEDQIIVIDNATNVALDVDVLANAFNMSRVEFLARRIVIDAFPDPTIHAVVMDIDWAQIYDDLFTMRTFKNEEGLYDNYILHIWQTISCSPLVNAVAFKTQA